jgi:hypothetical protein
MASEAKPSSLCGRMLDRRVASLLAMTVLPTCDRGSGSGMATATGFPLE